MISVDVPEQSEALGTLTVGVIVTASVEVAVVEQLPLLPVTV